jgi:hypothetical protein
MKPLALLMLTLCVLVAAGFAENDGPYVYWQSDSVATVFYKCNDSLLSQRYSVDNELTFNGLCSDSMTSYTVRSAQPLIDTFEYDNAEKVFAVSDIHGEYEYFREILQTAGVIDSLLNWTWGDGDLVINGDVVDRGDMVIECLWLIHRLESEAKTAGGKVHFLLGNHEIMVLQGDNRYVHNKYIQGAARKSRIQHDELYGPDMEFGRWLRTKHTILRINKMLFVHGGISPELLNRGYTFGQINAEARACVDLPSYRRAFGADEGFLFGGYGPFWYRGLVKEYKHTQASQADVERILDSFGAATIIIGHSEFDRIRTGYEGRVISIDTPYDDDSCLQGLLWEDGQFITVSGKGERGALEE